MARQARRDREERRDRCACREFYPAADQFLGAEIILSTAAEAARRGLVISAKAGIRQLHGSRLFARTTENCLPLNALLEIIRETASQTPTSTSRNRAAGPGFRARSGSGGSPGASRT